MFEVEKGWVRVTVTNRLRNARGFLPLVEISSISLIKKAIFRILDNASSLKNRHKADNKTCNSKILKQYDRVDTDKRVLLRNLVYD